MSAMARYTSTSALHGLNRATAKSVVQKNFGVKNAYYGGTDETYFADLLHALCRVPRGSKIDCHRHWEALALGAAPIVLDSPLTRELFYGLPALLLESWDALTPDLLRAHQKVLKAVETHGGGFDWARLSIERWRTEVAEARPSRRRAATTVAGATRDTRATTAAGSARARPGAARCAARTQRRCGCVPHARAKTRAGRRSGRTRPARCGPCGAGADEGLV